MLPAAVSKHVERCLFRRVVHTIDATDHVVVGLLPAALLVCCTGLTRAGGGKVAMGIGERRHARGSEACERELHL